MPLPTSPPPALGHPGPAQGVPFLLVMAREAPLSLSELDALRDAAAGAPAIPGLQLHAVEGFGKVRVQVSFPHPGAPWGTAGLTRLPELLHTLARAVPRCKVRVSDPAGLLAWTGSRFTLLPDAAGKALPGIREGYRVPATACLLALGTGASETSLPTAPDACTADVLEAVDRGGLAPDTAARVAEVGSERLVELVEGRVLPGAAMRLLGARGVDTTSLSVALGRDGDASERDAAGLRNASPAPTQADEAAELESGAVTSLGRLLLERPRLGATGSVADDDDLLLFDDEEEQRDPLELALEDLAGHPTVAAAAGVVDTPGYAERVLRRLSGFNDSATGACLLLCLGAWTHRGVPGLSDLMRGLVEDPERPWPLRSLALDALMKSGRPDARKVVLAACVDPSVELARRALRLTGELHGADARAVVRDALARPETRLAAIRATAAAADTGAGASVAEASRDAEFEVRSVAAAALPRVMGAAACTALRALSEDVSWEVRSAAACALAAVGETRDFASQLDDDDPDVVAAVVAALGEHDRADQWPRLLGASRHGRPTVRAAAAQALGTLGLPAATTHLTQLVADTNPTVQIAALTALGRCGDRRGVHALRRHAAADGAVGAAARAALADGLHLRKPAPDGRIRIRVTGTGSLDRVGAILEASGLTVTLGPAALEAAGSVEADDVVRLVAVRDAIADADAASPGHAWSVRDGQYAIRRLDGAWLVSGTRGTVARDAGWFDDPLPVPVERAPLAPLPRSAPGAGSPMAMAPLPVAVMRHVAGRKQVVAAADPERPYDPDEITGEVPLTGSAPVGAPGDDSPDAGEGIRWDTEEEPQGTGEGAEATPDDWDDLLSEQRSAAAVARIAARGLDHAEREQLVTWLASGLPGVQLAAARLAGAAAVPEAFPPLLDLLQAGDSTLRSAAAEALGHLGDPAALSALEASRAGGDPEVAAAASAAVDRICGLTAASGEE